MGWNTQRSERRGIIRPRALVLAIGLLAFGMASTQAQEVRTWADGSGKFKIQAKFVSTKDGVVTLEQTDGENIEIELKSLAPADQKYVADRLKAEASSPFKKATPSPFKKKAAGAGAMDDSAGAGGGEGRLVKPDWAGAQAIPSAPSSSEWKVPVSSAAAPAPPAKLRVAGIPPKTSFFEGSKAVVINAAGTKAVVGYNARNPGVNQKGASRVILCDLENGGRPLGVAAQPDMYAPAALSDDGMQVLMKTDETGPGGQERLEFWNMGKSGLTKGDQWIPYDNTTGPNRGERDVKWAAYLDAKRLATISDKGILVIWQIKPLKPLAYMDLEGGCTPALSPDRKLLAFATPKEIGVLDTTSLEVLAAQPAPSPNMHWTSFAFSPSGKRLACKVFVSKLFIYDVAMGAEYREISLQGLNAQSPAVFTDDDHVILGDHTLVDLESQVRLWQYNGNERVVQSNGICWFEVAAGHPNQAGALVAAKVPPPSADQALKRAAADPNFFILKSGKSVSIDVNGIPDASQRNNVAQALKDNLAKNGVSVSPGNALVVIASLEPGKQQEIAYRSIGRGGRNVDRFQIRPWTGRIKFVYNGQTAWETSASTIPFMDFARLGPNESLQDHVKKFEQPNYKYFGNVEFPKLLTKPTGSGAGTLGVSQVTVAGVR